MENRNEEKNYCKECKAIIDAKYDYCRVCNEEKNIEIGIINKFPNDLPRTLAYYKVILLDMFGKHDKIIMSFTKDNAFIADIVIRETNYFYLQEQRYDIMKEKLRIIKAPLYLISQVKQVKNDRASRQLKWYD